LFSEVDAYRSAVFNTSSFATFHPGHKKALVGGSGGAGLADCRRNQLTTQKGFPASSKAVQVAKPARKILLQIDKHVKRLFLS